MKKWYYEYLLTLSCIDCGESRPETLEFDHRDPTEKSFTISTVIGTGYSKKRILDEIAKCDVVCSNCHAVRTAKLQGWYGKYNDIKDGLIDI